ASLTDADPAGVFSDYSSIVAWGDGQISAGAIRPNGRGFYITGAHTYTATGNYTVSVLLSDRGGSFTFTSSLATVGGGQEMLTAKGTSISATEGTPFPGAVAFFTDNNPNAMAGDFTSTIAWGD